MAEAYLKILGAEDFLPESAGLQPGTLNARVVEVMREDGIDISGNPIKSVFDLLRDGRTFDAVVTVCGSAGAGNCPVFSGKAKCITWSFAGPSAFMGSEAEILKSARRVRDEIKASARSFIAEAKKLHFRTEP